MSIKDYLFPLRRTDITAIRISKIIFLSLLYIGVIVYFCWKAYKLSKNEKTLSYERDNSDPIPAPIVTFISPYQLAAACGTAFFDETAGNCSSYVNVDNTFHDYGLYALTFSAPSLKFADPNGNSDGPILEGIVIVININDPKYPGGDASLNVLFTDKDMASDLQVASQKPHVQGISSLESTALLGNLYFLANNQTYITFYERKISNFLNQNAVNVLSGNGNHKPVTLIRTTLVSYPNLDNPSYTNIIIKPSSYVVITETEDSSFTVSDLISAVGGIYGAAIAIYVFVFGADGIGPWGFVQSLLVRKKVRARLYDSLSPNIPFSGPVFSKGLSSDEKIDAVGQRLLSLELFLKEYVVDAEAMIKDDANERDIEAPTEKHVDISEN